ncbi:hypothetical protein CC2G_011405 [Coprinopsis cinerea AmutBmut pab1-1]|nr:hypothetical protein CC2G_011405 [Coprinopsis cinerea AmutBmut pab1-1]
MTRKSQVIKLLAAILVSVHLGIWFSRYRDLLPDFRTPTNASNRLFPPPELCLYSECLRGHWKRREPPFDSLASFQAELAANSSSRWHRCAVPPPPEGVTRTEEEVRRLEQDRLVELMNWVWEPERGRMVPWNAEDFVVKLLQRPAGIIFIGDSISAAHEHGFGSLLGNSGIRFMSEVEHLPFSGRPHLRQHILRPGEPMTLKLQRRAGVPDSRLRYPVFTIIEDHMLIHEPEIRRITEKFGASPQYHWYHNFKRVEGWEDYVKAISRPRVGEEDTVTGDTMLVMNAGAHWSRAELAMLPSRESDAAEQERVTASYREMMRLLVDRLSPIPRLSVYYRSTTPGHPNCGSKPVPYSNYSAAVVGEDNLVAQLLKPLKTDQDRKSKKRWDWDLFNVHNQLWRDEIKRLQALQVEGDESDESKARWFFLDFWEMTLQRPDAHSAPGIDCLHWCLPAVHMEWTYYLYHMVYLQSMY